MSEFPRIPPGVNPAKPGAEPAVTHIDLWGAEDPDLADSDGSHWWFGGVARRS